MDSPVRAFYDASPEYEWERLERHRMEFASTWRAMDEFIPERSSILDAGGGPGRYAVQLARAGHRVTLLDLAPGNVALARKKAKEFGVNLEALIVGDAIDLGAFSDASFDVVLNMGPLYHLTREEDRWRAIEESLRVLKPGGLLFASVVTRYAFLVDLLRNAPDCIDRHWAIVERLLETGVNIVSEENPGFTNAYFFHPSEVRPLMAAHGLTELRLAAAEGIVMPAEDSVNALPKEQFERLVDLCYRLGTDPVTWGVAEHMLYVGRRAGDGLSGGRGTHKESVGCIGRPVSRAEALRIARGILERAERERLELAEYEAARGIR